MSVLAPLVSLLFVAAEPGPVLPPRTAPYILQVNAKVQALLSQSKFEEAKAALDSWPGSQISYEVIGGEEAPKDVASRAAQIVTDATGGRIHFAPAKDGVVRIEFVPSAYSSIALPEWRDGKVVAQVPINWSGGIKTPKQSMEWAIAKAFAFAIGLSPTSQRFRLMGPVMYQAVNPNGGGITADVNERTLLDNLLSARETLAKAIAEKKVITPSIPKMELDKTFVDGGAVMQGTKPKFKFLLKNSGTGPLRIEWEVSCHCVLLNPPSELPAGKDYPLEPMLDTAEFRGPLERRITLYTNDPGNPVQEIGVRVLSMPEYRLLPENMEIVPLKDDGATQYNLTLYSTPGNPVEVLTTQVGKPGISAVAVPWTGEVVDPLMGKEPVKRTGYQIRVNFPAEVKPGLDFVRILVLTNSKATPYAEVTLQTQKGIIAQPRTTFFGTMRVGQKDFRTITLEHPFTAFKITELTVEGSTFSARYEKDGDTGRKYKIYVDANPTKPGFVNGKVIVKTDSQRYPRIEIPVSYNAQS